MQTGSKVEQKGWIMMQSVQKILLFLSLTVYSLFSFGTDSSSLVPMKATAMQLKTHVDMAHAKSQQITYTPQGHQIVKECDKDSTLVHIQNASDQVYFGPPAAQIIYGHCSGFGCYCAGSAYSCCKWCDPPVVGVAKVKWQPRPRANQFGAISENMPSVLSDAHCAPIVTEWERA
jgi:hypothetical protein